MLFINLLKANRMSSIIIGRTNERDTTADRYTMTISQAFESYRRDRIVFANKSVKTEESYRNTAKSILACIGEDIALEELTFDIIRSWTDGMRKRGLVSGTIRGYVVNLRAVLSYMQLLGHTCLDPRLISVPKRVDPTPSYLKPTEITQLIKLIDKTSNCSKICKLRNQAIVALLYSSAIRVSELCSLNREDIDGDVFSVLGKGKKRRACMIDARAKDLLTQYLNIRQDGHRALFVDNVDAERLTPSTVQALFRRLSKKFGKQVHPHTLRHSMANDLMRNGCHIYPLSRIMGHSSIATTQVYFSMFDPELAEVYQKYHTVS